MEFLGGLGLLALGSRMRAISERLYALADAVYAGRGLQVQGRWFPVLRLLHDRGPTAVGEIAQAIGQTHSAVSQLADKLVAEGWLQVQADAADKRRRQLALTDSALATLRAARPAWHAIEAELAHRCSAASIDLLDVLARFENQLDDSLAPAILGRCAAAERAAVQIVPFAPELREHFYRLNAAWLRKYFYLEEIDHRVLSNPETEILATGGAIFFARIGDQVVGTCALKCEAADSYELTKMGVDEAHQGTGIGRALLQVAIAEFQRRRGQVLFLETNSKLAPALSLYRSMGFEQQATPKPDSHYERSDVYMIWRPAGAAA